jgi:hypothetical protein
MDVYCKIYKTIIPLRHKIRCVLSFSFIMPCACIIWCLLDNIPCRYPFSMSTIQPIDSSKPFFFGFLSSLSFIFSKSSPPPFPCFLLGSSEKWRFPSPHVGVLSPFVGVFCSLGVIFFFYRLLMF